MSEPTTRELFESAAHGDPGAIESLLVKFLPGVRAFVRLRCGPDLRAKESSSDIVQSVCRELLQGLDGKLDWQNETAFRGWLFTAALRKVADRAQYFRAVKRDVRREVEAAAAPDETQAQHYWDFYRTLSTPSQHAIAHEQAERIEHAFEALDDEQREVIVLARIAGLSRAEIGERMGRSETSVRTLLHRALAELAEQLRDGD